MKRVAVLRNHALGVSVAPNTIQQSTERPASSGLGLSLDVGMVCRPIASPTFAAAFSRNKLESRIYRRTIALDRCPVCSMMLRSLAPAIAAEVARQAQRL
jgi:hypothetical protein